MKVILFTFLLFGTKVCSAQATFARYQQEVRRLYGSKFDSLAKVIDNDHSLIVISDTTKIIDVNDLTRSLGLIIETAYIDSSGTLRKLELFGYRQPRTRFYYLADSLFKAETDHRVQKKRRIYYYPLELNRESAAMHGLISRQFPASKEYWDCFSEGRSYLKSQRHLQRRTTSAL